MALLGAQLSAVRELRGTRTIGMFAVYLFLAAIGALCDVEALRSVGELGFHLLAMVAVMAMVFIWSERKVAGYIQSRYGPMYVGQYHGVLQSIADLRP